MICLRTLLRIYEKISNSKKLKVYWLPEATCKSKEFCFWGITTKLEIGIL
jgi:hypothetical protein